MGNSPRDGGSWWAMVGLYFYLVGICPHGELSYIYLYAKSLRTL